jgi:hypothetical protein
LSMPLASCRESTACQQTYLKIRIKIKKDC